MDNSKEEYNINEAYRYLDNAKEIIKKARKYGEFYQDPKYVKITGNTAWNGVLLALDLLMKQKKYKIKGRNDIDKYREFVAKNNKKILKDLNSAYNYLHLFMGYDGDLNVNTCKTGLTLAETILEWVKNQLK